MPFDRGPRVPAEVVRRAALPRGERLLARAATADGTWLLGTRDALVLVEPADTIRLPWEQVEKAEWDRDTDRLRVVEVGRFGQLQPTHSFAVPEPGSLLELVRERVTASVLLHRRVRVRGRLGLLVVARRPPRGGTDVTWAWEPDVGLDPDDPEVREAAARAMREAREELGGAG